MSTKEPQPERSTGGSVRRPGYYLGIDARGNKHVLLCYADSTDRIHVIRDGKVRAKMSVNPRNVQGYMNAVADKAGWKVAYFGPLAYEGYPA